MLSKAGGSQVIISLVKRHPCSQSEYEDGDNERPEIKLPPVAKRMGPILFPITSVNSIQ